MNNSLAQLNLNEIEHQSGLTQGQFWHTTSLGTLINAAIPWVFTIAGFLLLIYLIFGGLQLMLSQGDPKNAGAAKQHITNALFGFIIIFIAYWVVQLVGVIFKLQGINTIFTGSAVFGPK